MKPRLGSEVAGWDRLTEQQRRAIMDGVASGKVDLSPAIDGYADLGESDRATLSAHLVANEHEYQALEATKQANSGPQPTWLEEAQSDPNYGVTQGVLAGVNAGVNAVAQGGAKALAIVPDAAGFVARTAGELAGSKGLANAGKELQGGAEQLRGLSEYYAPLGVTRDWTTADNRALSAVQSGGQAALEFVAPMGVIGKAGKAAKALGASEKAAGALGTGAYFGAEAIPQTSRAIEQTPVEVAPGKFVPGQFSPGTAIVAGSAKAALMAVLIPKLMGGLMGGVTEAEAQAAAAKMLATPAGIQRALLIARDIGTGAVKGTAEMGAIGAGTNAIDELAVGRTPTLSGMTDAAVQGAPMGLVFGAGAGAVKRVGMVGAPQMVEPMAVEGQAPPVIQAGPVISTGPATTAFTNNRTPIDMTFEVVEAGDVKASKDAGYPAELQMRDATRQASDALINKVGAGPFAPWLGASNRVSDGAPIVGPDGAVEVGNHRTLGIRQAYQRGTADGYRQWLVEQAPSMGLDPVKVAEMKAPMLIRRRVTPIEDRVQFAKDANDRPMLGMSETEQAFSDVNAARDSINLLKRGSIESSGNQEFLQRFIQQVAPGAEQWSTIVDRDGKLSPTGIRRVRSALFALAYGGDQAAVERLAEGTDDQAANATKALQMAAPALGAMEAKIANGDLAAASIAPDVAAALNKLNHARAKGEDVIASLKPEPPSLEGTGAVPMTQPTRDVLAILEQGKRGHRAVADVLTSYADAVEKIGNPKQVGLDGEPVSVDRAALLRRVIAEKGLKNADELTTPTPDQGGLFEEPAANRAPSGVAALDPGMSEAPATGLAPRDNQEMSSPPIGPTMKDFDRSADGLKKFRAAIREWPAKIAEWARTAPDLTQFALDENRVRVASKNTRQGEPPWRVTRFINEGSGFIPAGHMAYETKGEAIAAAADGAKYRPDIQFMAGGVLDRRDQAAVPVDTSITVPEKRSDIVKLIREKLGVLRQGKLGQFVNKALAIFKIKSEVMRAKDVKDIEPDFHEVGHLLAKTMNITNADLAQFASELHPMASKGDPSQEGLAEFVRYYVTDEAKAMARAPNFFRAFETRLAGTSDIAEVLKDARGRWERYISQPPMQRLLSNMSTDPADGTVKRTAAQTFDDFYTMAVDQLAPIQRAVAEMTKGIVALVTEDAYKLARLFKGWTGKAATFIEFAPIDYATGNLVAGVKPLREILTPLGDKLKEFGAYLAARRTLELHGRTRFDPDTGKMVAAPIKTGIEIRDAVKVMADGHKEFGQSAKDLYAFQDSVLRYMLDAGVLSKESYDRMKEANRDYIPFYRIMGDGESIGTQSPSNGGPGMELRTAPIKRIGDSTRDIIDPIESVIKNTYAFIHAAERNAVGQALVEMAEKTDGMGKFVENIPLPKERVQFMLEDIKRQLPQDVRDAIDQSGMGDEVLSIFRQSSHLPDKNTLAVWRNGKMELFQISPEIEGAMKNLDAEQMNMLAKMLSIPAKMLRAGATLDPSFIVRNPAMDQISAYAFSHYGFKPIIDVARGLFHVMAASDNAIAKTTGKMLGGSEKLYWQWMASGGASAELVAMDRESMGKQARDAAGLNSGVKGLFGLREVKNPLDLFNWVMQPLAKFSLASEQATRLGEFAKGLKQEGASKAAVLNVAFNTREVSLDFARSGSKTKALNSIAAFFNAGVQGFDKAVRELSTRPDVWLRILPLTLASVALAASQRDDPRYKEIPAWQRDMYWCVIDPRAPRMTQEQYDKLTPDQKLDAMQKTIIRIPKPREIGMLLISLPERIANSILAKDPHALDGFLKQFGKSLMPNLGVTAINPIIENTANYSFFTDRPIESETAQKLQPGYRSDVNTLDITKAIARRLPSWTPDIINSAPKIENFVQNYGGGVGKGMAQIVDKAARATGMVEDSGKPAATWADVPIARGFVVRMPTSSAESVNRWRANYERANQQLATWEDLVKRGQKTEAQRVKAQQTMVDLHKTQAEITRLGELSRVIRESKKMSAEQKRAGLDKAALLITDTARRGNAIADKIWGEGAK